MFIQTVQTILATSFQHFKDKQRRQAVSAPARIALSKETEERKETIWKKVAEEAARNYETVNGLIRMDNDSICVATTRSR